MLIPSSSGPVVVGDQQFFDAVNRFARETGWLHVPVLTYATYGVALFAGLLLVGWWVARATGESRTVAAALWAPLGVLVAVALNQPLVNAFREPRPYSRLPDMLLLADRGSDYSFPSDHAVMAGAVAAGLLLVNRRLGVLAAAAAVLMAFARVYIGAHWPGDVEAGLVVGAVVTVAGFKAVEGPATTVVEFLASTPLRPLLVSGSSNVGPPSRAPEDAAITQDSAG